MSRVALPSEKIMATAGIYKALIDELHLIPPTFPVAEVVPGELRLAHPGEPTVVFNIPPVVMAALIEASVRIAMATDTRDMGIMVDLTRTCSHVLLHPGDTPDEYCTWPLNHEGPHSWAVPPVDTVKAEYQRFYDFVGNSEPAIIDAWHFTENARAQKEERARQADGDHFAYPEDSE